MLHGMDQSYIATPKDTVKALLESGNRLGGGVPLRKTFVQQGSRTAPQPGPLASLVRNGDQRGLDTFLSSRLSPAHRRSTLTEAPLCGLGRFAIPACRLMNRPCRGSGDALRGSAS